MLLLYVVLAAAVVTDFFRYRIPNGLVVAGYLAGILNCLYQKDIWYISLLDGIFILLLLYPLFAIGAFGGGDIKLLSVVGIFLGFEMTVNVVIMALIAGAVCSVIKIVLTCLRKQSLSLSHLYIHFSLPIFIGTSLTHLGGITWITF
jgi:prepilin peptidase CpaA